MKLPRFSRLACLCVVVAAAAALLFSVAGCSPEQVAALKASRAEAGRIQVAATQTVSDLQKQLDALPENDPLRAKLGPLLAKAEKIVADGERILPQADALIALAEKGDLTDPAVRAALAPIPYSGFVLAALTGVAVLLQGRKISDLKSGLALWAHAFGQVVQSVESVLPSKTPEQKQALAAGQDAVTQRLVDQVKKA